MEGKNKQLRLIEVVDTLRDYGLRLVEGLSEEKYTWTYGSVKQELKKEVLKMLNEGIKQKSIAETLNISTGYVSKIKKESFQSGFITKKGQLRQAGINFITS